MRDLKEIYNNLKKNIMKKLLYLFIVVFAISFIACDKEEDIVPVGADDTYLPQPSDTELGSKIYDLYDKYGVAFLYDFEKTIFDWNMVTSTNDKFNISLIQKSEELSSRIDFLKENWLSAYPDEFIKTKFPIRILLLDTIVEPSTNPWASDVYFSSLVGLNNIAISNMGNAFVDVDKIVFVNNINVSLLADYLFAKEYLTIPEQFYIISGKELYNERRNGRGFMDNGFFEFKNSRWVSLKFPDSTRDLKAFVSFYIETAPVEVEAQIGEYPKMMEKYNIVKNYIESQGINLHSIE